MSRFQILGRWPLLRRSSLSAQTLTPTIPTRSHLTPSRACCRSIRSVRFPVGRPLLVLRTEGLVSLPLGTSPPHRLPRKLPQVILMPCLPDIARDSDMALPHNKIGLRKLKHTDDWGHVFLSGRYRIFESTQQYITLPNVYAPSFRLILSTRDFS